MAEPSLLIEVDGRQFRFRRRDMTAIDARDFRANVGMPLSQVDGSNIDVDVIAGLIWLIRRKTERGLSFEAVANSLSYDSDVMIDMASTNGASNGAIAEPEPDDPET